MQNILLTIHALIALTLVGVVLMQRSEGGALGIGGGGGGGFMSARGKASFLTRLTSGLAVAFMSSSLILAVLANQNKAPQSIFDNNPELFQEQTNINSNEPTKESTPTIPTGE